MRSVFLFRPFGAASSAIPFPRLRRGSIFSPLCAWGTRTIGPVFRAVLFTRCEFLGAALYGNGLRQSGRCFFVSPTRTYVRGYFRSAATPLDRHRTRWIDDSPSFLCRRITVRIP